MILKAHPSTDNPSVEWRPCLDKVYLICKTIEKWKEQYNFPCFTLKPTFLWPMEEKWSETGKEFTKDDILSMIRKVYIYFKIY